MILVRGLGQCLTLRKHSIKGSDEENDGDNRTDT